MRKVIWCSVALGMFGMAGAYYAACYAAKHPDCFLARCAKLASYVGARCSPLLALAPTESRAPKATQDCAPPPPCAVEQVIAGLFDGSRGLDAAKEPIEPILVEPVDPGLVPEKLRPEAITAPETGEPARLEITDPRVPLMPYAEATAPAASPSQALVNACWNWFASRVTPTGSEEDVCPASCFIRMSVQPFHDFIKVLHEETATELRKQIEDNDRPEPAPLPPDLNLPFFPQLQVDPHHHHHYPSCPYTGRCPAPLPSGRGMQPLDTPRTVPVSPVPRNEAMEETSASPKPPKKWPFATAAWGSFKPSTSRQATDAIQEVFSLYSNPVR